MASLIEKLRKLKTQFTGGNILNRLTEGKLTQEEKDKFLVGHKEKKRKQKQEKERIEAERK